MKTIKELITKNKGKFPTISGLDKPCPYCNQKYAYTEYATINNGYYPCSNCKKIVQLILIN